MPESEIILLENYLLVGALLFGIGLVGFLARRNMIVMFLSAEMMLQGVSLSLVAWGRYHAARGIGDPWGGQMLVVFIITVAACEAAIALALVLMIHRSRSTLDVAALQSLREENQPAYVDQEVPEETEPEPNWPHLTPAGVEPEHDEEELLHRPRV